MVELGSVESPLGSLSLAARGARLCMLHFGPVDERVRRTISRWYPGEEIAQVEDPAGAAARLACYFGGDLTALDGIGVELNGTAFQRRVWEALGTIRVGTTASYAHIARAIAAPAAVRAVGAANGANPVAIVVPCHRVIGTSGKLTGYGGGLERKRWLLEHERAGTGPVRTLF